MQTFLPYRRFDLSAKVLDNKRLGKQRVETMQIMHALVRLEGVNDIRGGRIPWGNHPATRMWLGSAYTLMSYQQSICIEWVSRGFKDTCFVKTQDLFESLPLASKMPHVPRWMGLRLFHSKHRANLLRKDPEHYGKFGWTEEPEEGYWWPKRG